MVNFYYRATTLAEAIIIVVIVVHYRVIEMSFDRNFYYRLTDSIVTLYTTFVPTKNQNLYYWLTPPFFG